MKMQLHLLTYYRNLVDGISNMSQEIEVFMDDGAEYSPESSPTKEATNKVIYEGSCLKMKKSRGKTSRTR